MNELTSEPINILPPWIVGPLTKDTNFSFLFFFFFVTSHHGIFFFLVVSHHGI